MEKPDKDLDLDYIKEVLTPVRPSHTPTNSCKFLLPPNFLNLKEVNNRLEDYLDDAESDVQSVDSDIVRVQLQAHHEFFQKYHSIDRIRNHSSTLLTFSDSCSNTVFSKPDR